MHQLLVSIRLFFTLFVSFMLGKDFSASPLTAFCITFLCMYSHYNKSYPKTTQYPGFPEVRLIRNTRHRDLCGHNKLGTILVPVPATGGVNILLTCFSLEGRNMLTESTVSVWVFSCLVFFLSSTRSCFFPDLEPLLCISQGRNCFVIICLLPSILLVLITLQVSKPGQTSSLLLMVALFLVNWKFFISEVSLGKRFVWVWRKIPRMLIAW